MKHLLIGPVKITQKDLWKMLMACEQQAAKFSRCPGKELVAVLLEYLSQESLEFWVAAVAPQESIVVIEMNFKNYLEVLSARRRYLKGKFRRSGKGVVNYLMSEIDLADSWFKYCPLVSNMLSDNEIRVSAYVPDGPILAGQAV